MRTRVTTVLSVIGVLTAGTAAAAVNTQIFESQPAVSDESSAMLAPQPTTVGLSLDATSTTSTVGDGGVGLLTEYVVGDAGVVTLDVVEGRLRIVTVAASEGWTVSEQDEKLDEDRVEVTFTSGSLEVEFEADYTGGEIIPEVDSEQRVAVADSSSVSTATTAASEPATAAPPPIDHDDDDHDDDDHDDDDHDDHDDDDDDHDSEYHDGDDDDD